MNRLMCRDWVLGWAVLLVLLMGMGAAVRAQEPAPPAPAAPTISVAAPLGEAGARARELADRVRELGDAIAADLGKTPAGQVLVQDARELEQAVAEFIQNLRGMPDVVRRRQLYTGVDASWHHLRAQLGRAGASSPAVDAAARRVAEADAALHKVLGLNAYPAIYYGDRVSPGSMGEIQRLARALVDRAEALLVAVRVDIRGPIGSRLAEEVTRLVQAADIFHDGINIEGRADDITRNGFAGVTVPADAVAVDLPSAPPSDRVRAAWRDFQATETLMRRALKLPPRAGPGAIAMPVEDRTPVQTLAERLVAQLDDFLIVFTREARYVQEGGYFIADARRLLGAAQAFRAELPRAADIGQLAYAFRDVDSLWEVLARRTNRIAAGRTGSNIQRIEAIGQTIAEIHQLLGMPGVPATVGPFGG